MPLFYTFKHVHPLGPGLWQTQLSPNDTKWLGRPSASIGDRTVVLIEEPNYSEAEETLAFEPSRCALLNAGSGAEAILLCVHNPAAGVDAAPAEPVSAPGGDLFTTPDQSFLTEAAKLGPDLARLGRELLGRVRQHYRHAGLLATDGGRFKEAPDNFWTIKVQPRDRSYAITVRGRPDELPRVNLEVKSDRPGYSRFKLANSSELEDAITVVLGARRH